MRDGLTASVIGEEEEQGRQERTSGRPLDAVRGRGIKRIDRQAGYSHAGRWDLQFSHAKGSWSREAGTGMAERWMQEEAYRTNRPGNRRPQGAGIQSRFPGAGWQASISGWRDTGHESRDKEEGCGYRKNYTTDRTVGRGAP